MVVDIGAENMAEAGEENLVMDMAVDSVTEAGVKSMAAIALVAVIMMEAGNTTVADGEENTTASSEVDSEVASLEAEVRPCLVKHDHFTTSTHDTRGILWQFGQCEWVGLKDKQSDKILAMMDYPYQRRILDLFVSETQAKSKLILFWRIDRLGRHTFRHF